ncbi:MFS transporter [Chachezhania sediminis]|uniref:MFS transporter n=1 Tax=Chachezhania sediminis TaxID=2599291 RepID=UPI00131A6B67|nr:MFS transporter [Chachezhania sediminis]
MLKSILPLSALLLGSAFLMFAGGVNGLILPIRGEIEGMSAASLGLLGTGWALGYVLGCLRTSYLVARVGHVRVFGAMCAVATISILFSLLFVTPWVWIPLRGLSGFCFAGAAMVVESWINEHADHSTRGRVFGIYTMVNLAATTAGQLALTVGNPAGFLFFVLPAIVYCMALLPTAISAASSPSPIVSVKLDVATLWRNSPVAVFGVFMVGISNGAFGTLAAVYAAYAGLAVHEVAFFAALPVLAGAIAQLPIGYLSDRFDRRLVLIATAIVALAADATFVFFTPQGVMPNIIAGAIFGAAVFSMQPIIVAHANDYAEPGKSIQVAGGLLLVFGIGTIIGPTVAGLAMSEFHSTSLFWITAGSHILLILFAVARIRARDSLSEEDKGSFVASPLPRSTTPVTQVMAES